MVWRVASCLASYLASYLAVTFGMQGSFMELSWPTSCLQRAIAVLNCCATDGHHPKVPAPAIPAHLAKTNLTLTFFEYPGLTKNLETHQVLQTRCSTAKDTSSVAERRFGDAILAQHHDPWMVFWLISARPPFYDGTLTLLCLPGCQPD